MELLTLIVISYYMYHNIEPLSQIIAVFIQNNKKLLSPMIISYGSNNTAQRTLVTNNY